MIDNNFCVYIHKFKNRTIYIGKGRLKRAFQFSKIRRNIYWGRLFDKYGTPSVRIVSKNISEMDALSLESKLIDLAINKSKAICNITLYNHPNNLPDESRRKFSQPRYGKDNPNYGNSMSIESKNKISEANKGRFIGDKSGRYDHKIQSFIHKDHGQINCTQYELRARFNLGQSQLSLLCSGRIKSCYGWRLSSTSENDIGPLKGKSHGMYDHTVFKFVHKDGAVEFCTKNELATKYNIKHTSNITTLCKGRIKTYKGWSVDFSFES